MARVATKPRPIAHVGPQPVPLAPENRNGTGLGVLLVWLTLFWAALKFLVGWPLVFPALPGAWPSWPTVEVWLNSAILPTEWLVPAVGLLAWTVWWWTSVFVVVRLTLNGLDALTQGAAWVRAVIRATDWLMLPSVRHAVDASLAGLLVARVLTVPATAAAQTTTPIVSMVSDYREIEDGNQFAGVRQAGVVLVASAEQSAEVASRDVIHTVRRGETWSSIARDYFGDEEIAEQLLSENVGRAQPYGQRITRNGLIHQGWTVCVAAPTRNGEAADEVQHVTVQHDETMWGIAERDLGDGTRWPDIFSLSKGAVSPDGHVLSNPNLIWAGLVLDEPAPQPAADEEAESPPGNGSAQQDEPSKDEPPAEPPPAVAVVPATPTAAATEAPQTSTVMPGITAQPSSATHVSLATPQIDQPPEPPASSTGEQLRSPIPPFVGGAAGAGVAIAGLAGAALVLRRRHRLRGTTQPESDVAVTAGFAEAELTDDGSQPASAEDLTTASLIISRLSAALGSELARRSGASIGDLPTGGTTVAGVRHGRSSTTLMLQRVPMAARAQVIACLPDAATRAFGVRSDVEGMVSRDGDVLVRLTGVANQTADDTLGIETEAWPAPAMLLPLGLLADRQVFAANWDALGHILVAAPLGQGAEAVLSALVASLVARRSPAQLGLVVFDSARGLPDELLGLPHVLEAPVDPHDEQAALEVLRLVGEELEERIASDETNRPDVVVVLTELGQMSAEHLAALGPIMLHGPRYRVRVIAASVRRAVDLVQHCPLLPEFGTRLVLRTADEEESIALLGSGDATELGPGGHLLARLEGRVSLQAHGYRVTPDRLARLAALIRSNAEPVDWWKSRHQMGEGGHEPHTAPEQTEVDTQIEQTSLEELPCPIPETFDDERAGEQAVADADEHHDDPESVRPPLRAESNQAPGTHQPSLLEALRAEANGTGATAPPGQPGSEVRSPSVPAVPRPRFRARFLGTREFTFDGVLIPYESPMELLVFLGVQDPSGARPSVVSDSLWDEDEDEEMRSDRVRKLRYRMGRALKRLIPGLDGDPVAPLDKQHPVYRLNLAVIETDVHRFLKLLREAESLGPEDAAAAYEEALELYRGDMLDRPDVPSYRWIDDGPRLVDLRVKYARMQQQARRRLADLLTKAGTGDGLARAEELYIGLAGDDPLDHRLWEALARLHGRRNDLLGLEATVRRLRSALAELGEADDVDRVSVPPTLERVFAEVRASLLTDRAA